MKIEQNYLPSSKYVPFLYPLSLTYTLQMIFQRQWIIPQIFKLLPKRHIFFNLVKGFIKNRKYAFFCIFYAILSADNIIIIHWIKIDHVQL